VALQEIRWSENGVIKKKDFSLYYSGTKEQLGQAGTGFILMGRIMNNVIGFEAINERICNIRIKGKYNNVSLVNMYAPTEDKAGTESENFYEELQSVIDQIPKSDTILVLGDANAKLGKEDIYKEVNGKYTLHELSNRNGEMLLEFAIGNNLLVRVPNFNTRKYIKGLG
jgi:exonuclease III